ncbi:MAG: DUF58 domain-containing protein [Treponema sp.]|jgi:uncharacterized protein (DUF58 family)|nr:DUF58 domain-containing protein [Treponema sp.]
MDTHELLRKISTFPIAAEVLAEDLMAGNFRSIFKGQGMEFDEVRHYQWGDDARSIDWNASARFGVPFVKMYREERELTIMILLDTSASMRRRSPALPGPGGDRLTPYEQALLASALIALSAERTGQRVGAFLFDREIDRVFPPRKGRRHAMALISGALQYQNRPFPRREHAEAGSNLREALAGAGRLLKRRSLVVLISDFLSVNWERDLGDLSRKHDVIALRISDPLDTNLPDLGLITMEDPETGLRIEALSGSAFFRDAWSQWHKDRAELWVNLCRRAGAARLELSTAGDAAMALFRFFGGRPYSGRRRAVRRERP